MAAPKKATGVTVGNTSYEIVAAEDCGPQFSALVKTVSRGEGKDPKVKRLVFNTEHKTEIGKLFQ